MNKVYILGIHIEQVRHLKDVNIPMGSDGCLRHLILTGKNGSGKTSVLDAIAGYLDSVSKGQCPSTLARECEQCRDSLEHYQIDPEANKDPIRQDKENFEYLNSQLASARHGIDLSFNMEDADVCAEYKNGKCLFAHFKAQRQFDAAVPSQIEKVVFDGQYSIDNSPRALFIKYLLDLKMTQALADTGGRQERADEIQRWFDRVRDILREIYEDPTLVIAFDEETFRFSIRTQGREPFDFNEASDGFSAVIDIIVDLMLRMVHQNGRATDFDMPGIALIDEVENHLHLSLQRKVLPMLVKLFPNIQFIITTHSPFVLSSLDDAVVYDLESGVLVSDGLSDNTYESIVEGYFNVDSLSAELRKKYDRYKELAALDGLNDDEFLEARKLEMYLDEIPDYLALGITTEYQRAKLELHGKVVA